MHIVSVVSARPNFVKLAAICYALRQKNDPKIQHTIIHTGQHYDPLLSDIFFTQLNIDQPTLNLGIGGLNREETIRQTQQALEKALLAKQPDWVFVYGDVNGAVGALQAAKKLGIRVAHIESGLRSGDKTMPEELNRITIDESADLLFCTETSGLDNLKQEGISGRSFLVGNTMVDTLLHVLPQLSASAGTSLQTPFVIATIHRPSNVDDEQNLQSVLSLLTAVNRLIPVYLPVHPRLRRALESWPRAQELAAQCHSIDPLGYMEFLQALQHCSFILTDSGGIQEEAVILQKRCFTLRRNTERPSTIICGSNVLIDPTNTDDCNTVLQFAKEPITQHIQPPQFWDGQTGTRILNLVQSNT